MESRAVLFRGDTLFVIQTMIGPYSPQDRAKDINRKLQALAKMDRIRLDSFRISDIDEYSVISYRGQTIHHVSEEDAALSGSSQTELAEQHLSVLRAAFSELLDSRTAIYWVKRIGYTLLTLLGLILVFVLINRIFRRINKWLSHYEKGIMRKRTSLIMYFLPHQSPKVFLFLSKVVKVLLIILILFFYLPLLFSFFPHTENLVNRFYQYIAEPVKSVGRGLLDFLPNLFYIFVIIVIARYMLRILNMLSREIEEQRLRIKGFHKDWAQPTANIVAGIVITYMRPFMVGDRVKIGESMGDVLEKNLGDFYVEYELNVYTKQPKKMAILESDLNSSIREVFDQANVEILSPHYNAYRDGNGSTIPIMEDPEGPRDPDNPKNPKDSNGPKNPKDTGGPKNPKEPAPPKTFVDQVIDKVTGKA